jgi:branched-chain amino acid aminotransferase
MEEDQGGGSYTMQVKGWLRDIMYGNEDHEWGVVVDEEK